MLCIQKNMKSVLKWRMMMGFGREDPWHRIWLIMQLKTFAIYQWSIRNYSKNLVNLSLFINSIRMANNIMKKWQYFQRLWEKLEVAQIMHLLIDIFKTFLNLPMALWFKLSLRIMSIMEYTVLLMSEFQE